MFIYFQNEDGIKIEARRRGFPKQISLTKTPFQKEANHLYVIYDIVR